MYKCKLDFYAQTILRRFTAWSEAGDQASKSFGRGKAAHRDGQVPARGQDASLWGIRPISTDMDNSISLVKEK